MKTKSSKSTPARKPSVKRRNVYFRRPLIYDAFCKAVSNGCINARSASDRLEQLIANDVRRHLPKMLAAGMEIPDGVTK
jgi:hypothetical protein